jgi:hypothetical protein
MRVEQLVVGASFSFLAKDCAAQVADAGPDTLLCEGAYTMQGSAVPVGGTGTWTLLMGCATIIDPNAPSSGITGLCPGENVFVWEVFDGFATTSDTVVIGVVDLPMIADAGPDQTIIAPPFSAQLMANTPVSPSYCLWTIISGSGVIADPSVPYSMVSGLNVGENIFQWSCTTGPCITTDVMSVNAFLWTGLQSTSPHPEAAVIVDQQNECLSLITEENVNAVALTDASGRPVHLYPSGSSRTWSMAPYGKGIYFLCAELNGVRRVFRFVVSR